MTDRKTAIRNAALEIFLERGYAATTIAEIGRRSTSTVGSIYHAFKNKASVAYDLWAEARDGWTLDTMDVSTKAKPEKAIKAMISAQLTWGWKNPDLYRFHEELRARAATDPEFEALAADLTAQAEAGEALYAAWQKAGLVKEMSWPVASALILGPAQAYLDSGAAQNDALIDVFADAAWQTVKGEAPASDEKPKQSSPTKQKDKKSKKSGKGKKKGKKSGKGAKAE